MCWRWMGWVVKKGGGYIENGEGDIERLKDMYIES